jgi:hypothetical protein
VRRKKGIECIREVFGGMNTPRNISPRRRAGNTEPGRRTYCKLHWHTYFLSRVMERQVRFDSLSELAV